MSGTTPMRRQMACPLCTTKATSTLRFGDARQKPARPPTLELENHFPPQKYQKLCDASECALPERDWPAWAVNAVADRKAKGTK